MPYGVVPYGVDPYGNPDEPVEGEVVEVELPGVYVDNLVFDEVTEGLLLVNQSPEKGSTQNPVDTNVDFEIFDTSGTEIDVSTLVVTINGEVAYTNGAFTAGWDGADSSVEDNGAVVHVTVDPTTDFESEQIVVVGVVVDNDGATLHLDDSYAFKIEDITAPVLVSAQALNHMVVRIEYSESMLAVDAALSNDALNPANYTFTTDTKPAVPLVCLSVTQVTAAVYDLHLDIEMTPNAVYVVAALNVQDLFDNVIEPPDNDAEFIGYECAKPVDRDLVLWDWIPDFNKRADDEVGDLALFVACLQEVTDLLFCLIDRWVDTFDIDYAPELFVDAILVDLGNPFPFALSLADKRRLARVLVTIYRQKGTKQGIINVIRFFLGIEVEIEVFNNPDDAWILGESELGWDSYLGASEQYLLYSFRIIAPYALTDEQRYQMRAIARYMKVAHEHLVDIIEPELPQVVDHWELGLSLLGEETELH